MAKKSEVVQSVNTAAVGALTNQSGPVTEQAHHVHAHPLLNVISDKMKNTTEILPHFTGVARSVMCVKNQGFSNFQICTLHIEDGKITKMEKSDMWQSFEAFAFLELVSKISCDHLNNNFAEGRAFLK